MKARPLPQRAHEVRALLDGRRTVVRVPVRAVPLLGEPSMWCAAARAEEPGWMHIVGDYRRFCPIGGVGSRVWVREAWGPCAGGVVYQADDHGATVRCPDGGRWRSPVTMPRWASRLTLEVTDVRVERLGDVTEEDARAEGYLDVPIVVMMDGEPPSCGPGSGWCGGGAVSALSMLAAAWTERYGRRAPWEPSRWSWRVGVTVARER